MGRRLLQLANEREKLLRAYYADAIDVPTLKRKRARINAEVAEAESQLASDGGKMQQAKEVIDLALDLAENCSASYRKARPEVRKMWNRGLHPHNQGFATAESTDSRTKSPSRPSSVHTRARWWG